jgi:hypothetical protein
MSYFPKIRESTIARDKREKQLARSKQTRQVWRAPPNLLAATPGSQQAAASLPSKPLSTLGWCCWGLEKVVNLTDRGLLLVDQDGVAAMRLVFESCGHLDEEEFVVEMFDVLNAQNLPWEQQVGANPNAHCFYCMEPSRRGGKSM